jgi:hypothetical protein
MTIIFNILVILLLAYTGNNDQGFSLPGITENIQSTAKCQHIIENITAEQLHFIMPGSQIKRYSFYICGLTFPFWTTAFVLHIPSMVNYLTKLCIAHKPKDNGC